MHFIEHVFIVLYKTIDTGLNTLPMDKLRSATAILTQRGAEFVLRVFDEFLKAAPHGHVPPTLDTEGWRRLAQPIESALAHDGEEPPQTSAPMLLAILRGAVRPYAKRNVKPAFTEVFSRPTKGTAQAMSPSHLSSRRRLPALNVENGPEQTLETACNLMAAAVAKIPTPTFGRVGGANA